MLDTEKHFVTLKQILRDLFLRPVFYLLEIVHSLCAKPCSGALRLVGDGVKTRLSVQSLALSHSLAARTVSETWL